VTSTSSSPLTDADERAIRDVVARAQTAQGDAGALPALHTDDTVIVNLAGRRVLGRDAFAEAMAAALRSPLAEVRTSVEIVDVRPVAPGVVLVSCVKTVHDERSTADRSALPAAGALSYVLTRVDGTWLIALAHTTPVLDPAA
jgi:uncharacterized protein (TIGR02246 family)